MSITSVSTGTTASYTTSSQQKDVRNAFKQVADAINNGDLQGAQNAFASLAQLMSTDQQQTQGTASTSASAQPASSTGNDVSNLLDQIGTALQSGDLDQAKQALQKLQQTAQSSRPHHHHHGRGAGAASQSATSTTSASTDVSSIGGINLTV
jgi:ribosomal protein S20